MGRKCKYCGSTSYGLDCIHSPTRKHEHRDDEKHCEWCGSSSCGSGCLHSPIGKHEKCDTCQVFPMVLFVAWIVIRITSLWIIIRITVASIILGFLTVLFKLQNSERGLR